MKFLVAFLLTALLSFIGSLQFGWWIIAVVAFVVALLVHQRAGKAWLAGFLAVFVLWAALALWINNNNDGNLSGRIAELFGIGNSPMLLILITSVIGGLVGGFAAMTGSYLRMRPRQRRVMEL